MRKLVYFALSILLTVSCKKSGNSPEVIVDVDGNEYEIVEIGEQVWMKQNLRVTKYNDGVEIANETIFWADVVSTGAWAYPAGHSFTDPIYGKLYNGYAVLSGKLCPEGWKVPSTGDFDEMFEFLGGKDIAGDKIKSPTGWDFDGGGSNTSGFSALPAGSVDINGNYSNYGATAYFWTNTMSEFEIGKYWYRGAGDYTDEILQAYVGLKYGFSCRCIKE
jgi:uncharacterized protein (TIGR02145 family)